MPVSRQTPWRPDPRHSGQSAALSSGDTAQTVSSQRTDLAGRLQLPDELRNEVISAQTNTGGAATGVKLHKFRVRGQAKTTVKRGTDEPFHVLGICLQCVHVHLKRVSLACGV